MNNSTLCNLCPRACMVDRSMTRGVCGVGLQSIIARAAPHHWEEPCISGTRGAGTVFFAGCNLRCIFCQNYEISRDATGTEVDDNTLGDIFLRLADTGVHNLELVTATMFVPQILRVLDHVKHRLHIPVIWNTGGYESIQTLWLLQGYIDIYLPDFKYADPALAQRCSGAADYPEIASAAITEMARQTGKPVFDRDGILQRGTLVRHLVLPGCRHDSLAVSDRLAQLFSPNELLVSVMRQYTPPTALHLPPPFDRKITTFEYQSVCDRFSKHGFQGYFQDKQSANETYIPPFKEQKGFPTDHPFSP